jgi:hypothetical protein
MRGAHKMPFAFRLLALRNGKGNGKPASLASYATISRRSLA